MHVLFPFNRDVRDEHGAIIESFKAGDVVEFKDADPEQAARAERWIRRGCEQVDGPMKKGAAAASQAEATSNAPHASAGVEGGDAGKQPGPNDKGQSQSGGKGGNAKL